MRPVKTKILGTGAYIPKKIITNFDLEKTLDTSNEWIVERTGISERHISNTEGGEFPSDMAFHASEEALKNANLDRNAIDLIILATVTPDVRIPNTSSILQTKLGISNHCGCLDLQAACSGFVYALSLADAYIKIGRAKNVLVVGSEMLSTINNWEDRSTCILFGDGCGATILGITPPNEESDILATEIKADGSGREYMGQEVGGAIKPFTPEIIARGEHYMTMKGRDMYRIATRTLCDVTKTVLDKAQLSLSQLNWLIPHQANIRILQKTAELLEIPEEKVIINIQKYGNTSSASIPIAFHEALTDGRVMRGQTVVFSAFGAGLTYGAVALKY